jgi:NAD-dependent SIR2 family protein deacetylase
MPTELRDFIDRHPRLFVLTGAGCSTDSGIPDYRDAEGGWKRGRPVMYRDFMADLHTRRRYWARSIIGWRHFRRARPNDAHRALASLEENGRVELLVTQNVDRLHQASGSENVLDLHGRLDQVRCMTCRATSLREEIQEELVRCNPAWTGQAPEAPDGDADFDSADFSGFMVPPCRQCGGILKPDVVFFGESVPPDRVDAAMKALQQADATLVIGSSLMVYSGYRFVHAAHEAGKSIAAVNLGRTRADHLFTLKVTQSCIQAFRSV